MKNLRLIKNVLAFTAFMCLAYSTPEAPTPTLNSTDVISVYSDAYTDIAGTNFNPGWGQTTVLTEVDLGNGNMALLMTGLNYQGINIGSTDGGVPNDFSGMAYVHLDFWTSNSTALNFFLISTTSGEQSVSLPVEQTDVWVSVNIPLTAYTDQGLTVNDIHQFKFDGNGDIYLDNIYFVSGGATLVEAPTPTEVATDVISVYSDAYTDIEGTNFNPGWGQATVLTEVDLGNGNMALLMTGLNYQGINIGSTDGGVPNDFSGMAYVHLDFWTSNSTALNFFLISTTSGEQSVSLPVEQTDVWVSVNIPLTAYTDQGLTVNDIHQFKFDGNGDIYLDNIYFIAADEIPPFVINDFNTSESATDEGADAFWVEFDESESAQNYSTLVQIPADQAPDSDSPVMSWSWGTDGDLGWGGYTSVYHVYDAAVDISDFNYLSFKFRNLTPPSDLAAMSFRVNLFDVSDATTWETRDDTEVWFSFFEGEANSPFYNVADDGWVEYKIPLLGGTAMGPYTNGFVLMYASWTVGIPGNGVLDLDQIGGLSIEIVQGGTGTNYGEFLLEDIQAIYSADVPGCMDPNSCNYDPDATVDDGSCYECVDVTFNLDMSSISSYTESDTPYLAGGAFFGTPGNEDYALSYNSELSGDGHLVFSRTVQMQESTYFEYTYTSDGNPSYGTKENIAGQDCAVEPWSDRAMTTSTNDTTINACFGNCTDNEFCPAMDFIDVTFAVNMQNEEIDPTGVFLHGNWFGWGTLAMSDDDSDEIYELTISDMTPGATIEFKFMNGAVVEDVPEDCEYINNWGGGINRMYTLPADADTTIGPICFSGCTDCSPPVPVDVTFNVDMSLEDGFDGTEAPYVFGSFNNWNQVDPTTVLEDIDGDNVYTGTVNSLMSDQEHTFLFGYGTNFETVPDECGILDPDLGMNVRPLPIDLAGPDSLLILDVVPYGECLVDSTPRVLFAVDVSTVVSTFPEGYQVCVTGSFDGWSGWGAVLTDNDSDMVYTGTVSDLVADTSYEYKFVINGWDSGIQGGAPLGSDCDFIPTDEYNNYGFTAVEGLLELDEVCWGACVPCNELGNDEDSEKFMPTEFSYKTYPNPFNPYINIYYELPESELITITIMNLLGQQVYSIVNEVQEPGRYTYKWDGKNSFGQTLHSGIYFAVINRKSGRDISKITFLK
jgi:hypothetical protein